MVVLNGHEAGNGGHSQDATYRDRAVPHQRASSDDPPSPAGRGKPWTRGERDNVGEPHQRRPERARETKMGKGEIREDANAGAPRRLVTLPARPEGQAFPASSDDRPSWRKET